MKSIRTKILLLVGGVAILAMLISGIIITNNIETNMTKNQESISELTVDKLVANINEYFIVSFFV